MQHLNQAFQGFLAGAGFSHAVHTTFTHLDEGLDL